jgi:hypothetical protein
LINSAAADDRAKDAGLPILGWRDFREVVRQDEEVRVLALLQLALLPFLKFRIRGAGGVRADTILE